MQSVQKVAVVGSGVMGSTIAANIANSNTPVLLLDIVVDEAGDRDALSKQAIKWLQESHPKQFTHKEKSRWITPGNIDDDMQHIADADWIIEAVVEDANVKRSVYQKIEAFRKPGSVVSSNTSTLPMHTLTEGMGEQFKKDFMITHFFNPPRYTRLVEMVVDKRCDKQSAAAIRQFAEEHLGKEVLFCKDTPGFIANRIGCYWLAVAVNEALRLGLTVEEADRIMGAPLGMPKIGVFDLIDRVGIDTLLLVVDELCHGLSSEDPFCQIVDTAIFTRMIAKGLIGRKGRGGFYRLNTEGDKRIKEVLNLKDFTYTPVSKPRFESITAGKQAGLRALFTHPDKGGQYANAVLTKLFVYAAAMVPEISDDIYRVDQAMQYGYGWKWGPFALIDRLGEEGGETGVCWLAKRLQDAGEIAPQLLVDVCTKPSQSFYVAQGKKTRYLDGRGHYHAITVNNNAWILADKKRGAKPILANGSAKLWDVGDGIMCLEITSMRQTIDLQVIELIEEAIPRIAEDYKGLIIGNDYDHFSMGANIGIILFVANVSGWNIIEEAIERGQNAFSELKYAPFPVVSAVSGMALGGGCELLLHSDAIEAHIETYTGLVEPSVGVVPSWGGCKEMLIRASDGRISKQRMMGVLNKVAGGIGAIKSASILPAIGKVFKQIAYARVSSSAEEARSLGILGADDHITFNRHFLLAQAKKRCLDMTEGYQAPKQQLLYLPGMNAMHYFQKPVIEERRKGNISEHDELVSLSLARVLLGGDTSIKRSLHEKDILKLERQIFMKLLKTESTLERFEHMVATGKPLRN